MILREDMYFEPRIINESCCIRWYGEKYSAPEFDKHFQDTVYVRDSGSMLYVYAYHEINYTEDIIKNEMRLICKIKKTSNKFVYGRLKK